MRSLIPNSTQIPDVILDRWMAKLSGAEFKVLLYIARRTYGFGKEGDTISLRQIVSGIRTKDGRQLDSGTGLNKDTVCKALNSLEASGLVIREQRSHEDYGDLANFYRLNLDADGFGVEPEDEPENPTRPPVSENPTGGGKKSQKSPSTRVVKSDTPGPRTRQGGVVKPDTSLSENPTHKKQKKQETVQQETATTALVETKPKEGFAVVALSPSALGEEGKGSFELLVAEGFSRRDAQQLAEKHPEEVIRNQIGWLGRRTVSKNKLGFLRRAIEEGWPKPETSGEAKKRAAADEREARQKAEVDRKREIAARLRQLYSRLQTDAPEAFSTFSSYVEEVKAQQANRPIFKESPRRLEMILQTFDTEERRMTLMVEYFKEREVPFSEFAPFIKAIPLGDLGEVFHTAPP